MLQEELTTTNFNQFVLGSVYKFYGVCPILKLDGHERFKEYSEAVINLSFLHPYSDIIACIMGSCEIAIAETGIAMGRILAEKAFREECVFSTTVD